MNLELSEQEIRNCSARIFGEVGIKFYEFLIQMSEIPKFMSLSGDFEESEQEKRGREELVLRFFAAKDGTEYYHGNVAEWLNSYMEAILLAKKPFDYQRSEGDI